MPGRGGNALNESAGPLDTRRRRHDIIGAGDEALGRLHQAIATGDDGEALRYADRARRLMPATTDILHINARLLARRGEAKAALDILGKLADEAPDAGIEAEMIE